MSDLLAARPTPSLRPGIPTAAGPGTTGVQQQYELHVAEDNLGDRLDKEVETLKTRNKVYSG